MVSCLDCGVKVYHCFIVCSLSQAAAVFEVYFSFILLFEQYKWSLFVVSFDHLIVVIFYAIVARPIVIICP